MNNQPRTASPIVGVCRPSVAACVDLVNPSRDQTSPEFLLSVGPQTMKEEEGTCQINPEDDAVQTEACSSRTAASGGTPDVITPSP